jgi:uncharacterized peroxidase-related enzyme
MTTTTRRVGFLAAPELTDAARALLADDEAELGYVMNSSRAWAYRPDLVEELFALMGKAIAMHDISYRRRGIIVAACASAYGDSYCSLAWGEKLAKRAGADVAGAVLTGSDEGLTADERSLARWARKVARDPSATTEDDVNELRDAGFTDRQIFAITVFIGLRIGFSTINDALGLRPDARLRTEAPAQVVAAVTFGRPIDDPD